MKQAILVIAYRDFDHLESVIRHFDDDFLFFIHIDKKAKLPAGALYRLQSYSNVKVWQQFTVNWGHFAYLKTVLFLCSEALKCPEVNYLHFISGQDFPIKTKRQFKEFFRENAHLSFIESYKLPYTQWVDYCVEGGMGRLEYWYFLRFWNIKAHKFDLVYQLVQLQQWLGIKRSLPSWFPAPFGGPVFWSLNREAVYYLMEQTAAKPKLLNRFRYSLLPEEIYFHTLLLNAPFRKSIVNDNLRYIVWEERNGNDPANLDDTDFAPILESNAFFARKFVSPTSDGLKLKLQKLFTEVSQDQNVLGRSGS